MDASSVKEEWAKIMKFPEILFAAVKLPGFTEAEKKAVQMDLF
jgi:hypothetical protein